MNQVESLLTHHGFKLARQHKHKVWRHADGRVWIMGNTPSHRAMMNNYTDLRNFLERGKVQGTFGLTAINDDDCEAAERKLHPVKTKKPKPVKERNIGIAIERFKPVPVSMTVVPQQERKPKTETADIYTIGRILGQSFEQLLNLKLTSELAEYRNEVTQHARQKFYGIVKEIMDAEPGWSEQDVTKAAEDYIQGRINQEVTAQSQYAREQSQKICRAATRIYKRIAKRMKHEQVDAEEVQTLLSEEIQSPAAEFIFAIALFSFFPATLIGIKSGNDGAFQVTTADGKLLVPSDVWNENLREGWDGTVKNVLAA